MLALVYVTDAILLTWLTTRFSIRSVRQIVRKPSVAIINAPVVIHAATAHCALLALSRAVRNAHTRLVHYSAASLAFHANFPAATAVVMSSALLFALRPTIASL